MHYEVRAEQEIWKSEINHAFLEHDFVMGQAATAFGKTRAFIEMTKGNICNGRRVAIVCHRGEIMESVSDRFLEEGIVHGFQAGGYSEHPEAMVQIGTPQSFLSRINRYTKAQSNYQFVIEDEAHRGVSKTYLSLHEALMLSSPGHYRLGVTATPIRLDNKPLNLSYQTMKCAPQQKELIRLGRLVQPVVFSPPCDIDFSGVKMSMGDLSREGQARVLNNKKFHGTVLDTWEKHAAELQTIVFASTIEHAHAIRKELEIAAYAAEVLEGKLTRGERREMVNRFKKRETTFLISVELLTEGFDAPGVECVIFARRTMSTQLWLQAIGRGLRAAPGKTKCIVLDLVGNIYRHGSPDADREWTLDGGVVVAPTLHLIRQCQKCYAWMTKGEKACTECSTEFVAKERVYKTDPKGQLCVIEGIKPKKKTKMEDFKAEARGIRYDDPDGYRKMKELCERYGYAPGFARVRWNFKRAAARGGWQRKKA